MLIALASDLTGDDTAAFVHATALAVASGSRLVTIHGGPVADDAFPDARVLASSWNKSVDHDRRCHDCCDDVADTVIDALRELRPDLVVLGTHGRHGLAAVFRGSVSEAVSRNVDVPALVVPNQARGFVDPATGAIGLHHVLIPADSLADAICGAHAARDFVHLARAGHVALEILHVGAPNPELDRIGLPVTRVDDRSLEHAIVAIAHARDACVIVMPTRGHDGLGDTLLGSHTERVLRDAACPVLAAPYAAHAASN